MHTMFVNAARDDGDRDRRTAAAIRVGGPLPDPHAGEIADAVKRPRTRRRGDRQPQAQLADDRAPPRRHHERARRRRVVPGRSVGAVSRARIYSCSPVARYTLAGRSGHHDRGRRRCALRRGAGHLRSDARRARRHGRGLAGGDRRRMRGRRDLLLRPARRAPRARNRHQLRTARGSARLTAGDDFIAPSTSSPNPKGAPHGDLDARSLRHLWAPRR